MDRTPFLRLAPALAAVLLLAAAGAAHAAAEPTTFAAWAHLARLNNNGLPQAAGDGGSTPSAAGSSAAAASAAVGVASASPKRTAGGKAPKARAAAATLTADAGYYSHGVPKTTVNLMEVRHRDCRLIGNVSTPADATGSFLTSEFTCKHDHGSSYAYGNMGASNMFLPTNSIGSCDWTITWLAVPLGYNLCPWIPVIDTITYKVGTAVGTCYLGSGAELCGEPLCSNMIISVQGDVFRTAAYSHENGVINADDSCNALLETYWDILPPGSNAGPACPDLTTDSTRRGIWRAAAPAPAPAAPPAVEAPQQGARAGTPTQQQRANAASFAPAGKRGGRHVLQYGGHNAYGYEQYYMPNLQNIYRGQAFIISGTAQVIPPLSADNGGPHGGAHGSSDCERGLFEYVPYFSGTAVGPTSTIDPAVPWVRGNSYKFDFACGHEDDY